MIPAGSRWRPRLPAGYRASVLAVLVVALAAYAALPQPAALASVATRVPMASSAANLIVNGSFESPSTGGAGVVDYTGGWAAITGWTVGGNSVDLIDSSYLAAEDGSQSLDLSGSAPSSVSQTVSTTPGANYTLTWFMAGNTNCGQPVKTMNVLCNGTLIAAPAFNTAGDSNTSMGWVQQQVNVTATSTSSVVEFADATPLLSGTERAD
jgi:choice-of-anchor C domain-containing protein